MKDLGEAIGLAESTISHYETGKRQPDYETLLKLGEFFGVSVDYLLTGDENKKAPTQEGEREIENPDIRMIARAGQKMTPDQAKNLRKYAEFMFPEAFKDDDT